MNHATRFLHRPLVGALAALALGTAVAQQAADEPFWAKGRPKTDTAMKMAPVPAFPDQLLQIVPVGKIPEIKGAPLKLKVLLHGKPAAGVNVSPSKRTQGILIDRKPFYLIFLKIDQTVLSFVAPAEPLPSGSTA